jgi:hypothetical protein
MKEKIKLGQRVRDVVTGFTGIATARVEYISGCLQYCVQPPVAGDGKFPASEYIDHQRLEALGESVQLESSNTGGVMPYAPPRRA